MVRGLNEVLLAAGNMFVRREERLLTAKSAAKGLKLHGHMESHESCRSTFLLGLLPRSKKCSCSFESTDCCKVGVLYVIVRWDGDLKNALRADGDHNDSLLVVIQHLS